MNSNKETICNDLHFSFAKHTNPFRSTLLDHTHLQSLAIVYNAIALSEQHFDVTMPL